MHSTADLAAAAQALEAMARIARRPLPHYVGAFLKQCGPGLQRTGTPQDVHGRESMREAAESAIAPGDRSKPLPHNRGARKHLGPGDHPSGSPQSVHGHGRYAEEKKKKYGKEKVHVHKDELPEFLYHATTNLPAVLESGELRPASGFAGGLGGGATSTVSMTMELSDAENIIWELDRISRLADGEYGGPEEVRGIFERFAREDADHFSVDADDLLGAATEAALNYDINSRAVWEGKPIYGSLEKKVDLVVEVYRTGYLNFRELASDGRIQNPVIFMTAEGARRLDSKKLGIVRIRVADIPDDVPLFAGPDWHLSEIRSEGDWKIPIDESKVVASRTSKHLGPGDHPSGSPQDVHGGRGGGAASAVPIHLISGKPEWADRIRRIIAGLDLSGVSAMLIYESGKGVLGGVTYEKAGELFPETGEIAFYGAAFRLKDKALTGVIAHEVMHAKFQLLVNAWEAEAESGSETRGPLADFFADPLRRLNSFGGVTEYSRFHWNEYRAGRSDRILAIHEGLAEIHRLMVTNDAAILDVPDFWMKFYGGVLNHVDRLSRK